MLQEVWRFLNPWCSPLFTFFSPHSILPCIPPFICSLSIYLTGHFWYMSCTYFGIFQSVVGEGCADRTGQEQVLMLKGHAILVVHQESWPSLVWWETHLAYPSFLSCPGAYSRLPDLPLTFLSSLAQSHISTFNSPSLPLGPEASTLGTPPQPPVPVTSL